MNVLTTPTSESVQNSLSLVQQKLGRIPNMYGVMAHSPAVLEAYVQFSGALGKSSIGPKLSEGIALATAQYNACSYCLSAHAFFGKKVGLTSDHIEQNRPFESADTKHQRGLQFAKKLLESPV